MGSGFQSNILLYFEVDSEVMRFVSAYLKSVVCWTLDVLQ